jgi:hypothetical protein
VDVTPARTRDNLGRLAEALKELSAKLRVPELDYPMPIALDERTFDQGTTWTFVTNLGFLDVALLPDGTHGYDDLKRSATVEQITDTLAISVASLADVIRSKEAAGREKDRAVLPTLRQVLELSKGVKRGKKA